jgi:DNA-binding response OmpR family regulator
MVAVQADLSTPAGALLTHPAAPASTARDTILVVEDENNVAGLITCILERAGFRVLRAQSGTEGLERFETHEAQIALVMLDGTLPDMHGGELCRRLRTTAADLPVLFVSGGGLGALPLVSWSGGAPTDFLPKPFFPADVVKRVRRLLVASP